ncbi:MAG: T9SS type A sorting domain-containing protein [Hymenobacter sp.]|nr:MAG: T9SS type A sorting domain-containing protein [Hymenobacter sp.]
MGHSAEVRDLLGRAVRTATLPASGELSLAGLRAGTYLLTVDGTLTRRVSKAE